MACCAMAGRAIHVPATSRTAASAVNRWARARRLGLDGVGGIKNFQMLVACVGRDAQNWSRRRGRPLRRLHPTFPPNWAQALDTAHEYPSRQGLDSPVDRDIRK